VRVAIVGCGVMGRRHAATVARAGDAEIAAAVDIVADRARGVARAFGGTVARSVPDGVDVAIVATPTHTHAEVAVPLLTRGVPCLVEKPLAPTVASARALTDDRCFVGHVERFNPAIVAAGALSPRVVVGRRVAPPTGRSLDVDVVLDLMIHDLDLLLHWGGDESWAVVDAHGLSDTATVQLRSSGGRTASLLASRVATTRERVLHCYSPGRYTRLDLVAGTCHHVGGPRGAVAEGGADALSRQWEAFRRSVQSPVGPGPRATSSEAGLRAVQLAEDIREAVRT